MLSESIFLISKRPKTPGRKDPKRSTSSTVVKEELADALIQKGNSQCMEMSGLLVGDVSRMMPSRKTNRKANI